MYTKILDFLKNTPCQYTDSTGKFWDDEHISKYMLEAHLNPNIEAASRQHSFIEASAKWIAHKVVNPHCANLLDLGCGAGIYAEAFNTLGFNVTGIDFAKRSIDYAKEQAALKNKQITYHYQNYLEMDYVNQFDVVTLIFCDFGVLKPRDRALLLGKIKRALKPTGILILDGFTQNQYRDFTESKNVAYENEGFWSAVPYVCIKNNFRFDEHQTYLEQYIVITSDQCNCYNIWNQSFNKMSLSNELLAAGFIDFQFYGDICGKEPSEDSNTICVIAK